MEIEIKKVAAFPRAQFNVTVRDRPTTNHEVSLDEEYYKKLTAENISPEDLIENSFKFLLEKEPNTSILSQFSLKQIGDYFPDYEAEIKNKLQNEG